MPHLCRMAEMKNETARMSIMFALITSLTKLDCEKYWRLICEVVDEQPLLFTTTHVFKAVRHLSEQDAWQAWVIAYRVYTTYAKSEAHHMLNELSRPSFNATTGNKILVIAQRAMLTHNLTQVNNAAMIYVGVASQMQISPVSNDILDVLHHLRDRLPNEMYIERNGLQRFLEQDTRLRNICKNKGHQIGENACTDVEDFCSVIIRNSLFD